MFLVIFSCDTGTRDEEVEEETVFDEELDVIDTEVQEFMITAASSGKLEVQLGQMASDKAQNQEVKAFGQKLAEEHKNANGT